jgi:hypothetical protein
MSNVVLLENASSSELITFRLYWLRHLLFFVIAYAVAINIVEIALNGLHVYYSGLTIIDIVGMSVLNGVLFWIPQVMILLWIKSIRRVRPEIISLIGAIVYVTVCYLYQSMVLWVGSNSSVFDGHLPTALVELGVFAAAVALSVSVAVFASRDCKIVIA